MTTTIIVKTEDHTFATVQNGFFPREIQFTIGEWLDEVTDNLMVLGVLSEEDLVSPDKVASVAFDAVDVESCYVDAMYTHTTAWCRHQ